MQATKAVGNCSRSRKRTISTRGTRIGTSMIKWLIHALMLVFIDEKNNHVYNYYGTQNVIRLLNVQLITLVT